MKFLFFVLIAIIVIVLVVNYKEGKAFKYCPRCPPNMFYKLNISLPDPRVIACLNDAIVANGIQLDSRINFQNAHGKKMNAIGIGKHCPAIIDWFLSPRILNAVSERIGEKVHFMHEKEHYRIFARIYDQELDFLNWHYDNNFTLGIRYTLVIPLIINDCNTAEFQYKDRQSKEIVTVRLALGEGVLYNGSEMYHRITQQTRGCKRMVIVIPLYTNPAKNIFGALREKIHHFTDQKLTL